MMKHKTFSFLHSAAYACCGLAMILSCGQKTTTETAFTMKSDSIVADIDMGHFAISMDYPADTTSALAKAMTEYASEMLGGTYQGTYDSPHSLMAYYHTRIIKEWRPDFELYREASSTNPSLFWNTRIEKIAETPRFLTIGFTCETYQGGAHGLCLNYGVTFRKDDCRRIGWEILRNNKGENMQKLIRQGLREYFNVASDDDLRPMLFEEEYLYSAPLPQCPPLFIDQGVRFIYNQYEIAPYAAGSPSFVIPYDKLKDEFTVTGQRLCGITE